MGRMVNSSRSCVSEPASVGHDGAPTVIRARHDSADEGMFLYGIVMKT